jgi:hypothetical protein
MLGEIARQQKPQVVEVSTALTDAIMEHWTEQRDVLVPTLKPKEEEWREFWLSASSAHKWCPRMAALMTLYGDKLKGELIKADTMWLFEQGHVFHDVLQQKALMSLPREYFWGSWVRDIVDEEASKRAGHLVFHRESYQGEQPFANDDIERGWAIRPEAKEGEPPWRYVESKVRMRDIRVVVKMDGILALPGEKKEVLEIKTEDMTAGESLNPRLGGVARAQHVLQTRIAMMATGLERGRILYVLKGARKPEDAFIEQIVEQDQSVVHGIRKLASDCVSAVKAVEDAKDRGHEIEVIAEEVDDYCPRLDDCPMKSKGRARYCEARDLCFLSKKKK